jgi:hypothetical protein
MTGLNISDSTGTCSQIMKRSHIYICNSIMLVVNKNKTNSPAFNPQANYTDCATTTCQRNLVPTFADRG